MSYSWKQNGIKRKAEVNYREELFRREFQQVVQETYTNGESMKKTKRFRSAFTTEQINYLEKEFRKHPYIGNTRRKDVASVLNIPERAVKIWFQNRRMKEKKDVANKECDGEEHKHIKTGIIVDQLSSTSDLPTTNDDKRKSLPLLTLRHDTKSKINIDAGKTINKINNINENEIINSAASKIGKNNSGDTTKPMFTTTTSPVTLTTAFKSEDSKQSIMEIEPKQEVSSHWNQMYPTMEQLNSNLYSPVSPVPQDLSSYKQNSTQCQDYLFNKRTPSKTLDGNMNGSDIPLYLKGFYPQPYIPPGNMIWKPLNMTPIMSTGIPAMTISGNNPELLSLSQQQDLNRRNCCCSCHLKPSPDNMVYHNNANPQVQYVITAVPLQNSVSKF